MAKSVNYFSMLFFFKACPDALSFESAESFKVVADALVAALAQTRELHVH